jgi:hypothetical protein
MRTVRHQILPHACLLAAFGFVLWVTANGSGL